jgi:hypothetical protein
MAMSLTSITLSMEVKNGKEPKIDKIDDVGQKRQRAQNRQNLRCRSKTAKSPKLMEYLLLGGNLECQR